MADLSLLGENQKKALFTIKSRKKKLRKKKLSSFSKKGKKLGSKILKFRLR